MLLYSFIIFYQQLLYTDIYKFLARDHVHDFRTLCFVRRDNKEMFEKTFLAIVFASS